MTETVIKPKVRVDWRKMPAKTVRIDPTTLDRIEKLKEEWNESLQDVINFLLARATDFYFSTE